MNLLAKARTPAEGLLSSARGSTLRDVSSQVEIAYQVSPRLRNRCKENVCSVPLSSTEGSHGQLCAGKGLGQGPREKREVDFSRGLGLRATTQWNPNLPVRRYGQTRSLYNLSGALKLSPVQGSEPTSPNRGEMCPSSAFARSGVSIAVKRSSSWSSTGTEGKQTGTNRSAWIAGGSDGDG